MFNNSNATHQEGNDKIELGQMTLYLNGEKQDTWDMGSGTAAGVGQNINGLWLQIPRTAAGEILLDNVAVTTP